MLKKFILFVACVILISSNSYSKTNFYQVTGSISSVEVLKTYSTQKVPRDEKRCSIQRVPVNQEANKFPNAQTSPSKRQDRPANRLPITLTLPVFS